jgi:cytochrome c oxidase subunit 1
MRRGFFVFSVPMLWATGGLAVLTMAGSSALIVSVVMANKLLQDTYYVVSHWEALAWQATVFAVFAGWYYFFPKVTGYSCSERLGKVHFWLSIIGAIAIYVAPQVVLILILAYMPRGTVDVPEVFLDAAGYANLTSVIGAGVFSAGIVVFFVNMALAFLRRRPAP